MSMYNFGFERKSTIKLHTCFCTWRHIHKQC